MSDRGSVATALSIRENIPITLELPDALSFDEWIEIGAELGKAERGLGWAIGEWWTFGKQRYGDRLEATKQDWWKKRGLPGFKQCVSCATVWRTFDKGSACQQALSFTHHHEVAAIARKDMGTAQALLKQAYREDWSAFELRAEVRRLRTAQRIGELIDNPLPTDAPVHVLYMDPPWRYENPPMGGGNRSIENQYPTMTLDELKALAVGNCALENALLFMWATAPKLAECFELLDPWGFNYRTNMVWDKVEIGMGYHARNQHELLLICKRGEIPPPEPELRVSSIYREQRSEHSRKPLYFRDLITRWYPALRKRELFSRDPAAPGWEPPWGNEIGIVEAAE